MLEALLNLDRDIFLWINGMHNDFFDFIMFWISSKILWIPLYLFFVYILFRIYKKSFWRPLLVVILSVVLADLASVHLFKEVFLRPRPCHEPELEGLVHLVKGQCGGAYGFVSSHAANMFAIAGSLFFYIQKRFPKSIFALLIWAAIIGYSRIYLGVHYPLDVFGGALLGLLISLMITFAEKKYVRFVG